MEAKRVVLWDTDILIELFNENQDVLSLLIDLNTAVYYSVITYAELIAGASNKSEVSKIKGSLQSYLQLDIDSAITNLFRTLSETYTLSHGLKIPNAIIAATAITYDMELATCNKRDFQFIKGLRLVDHAIKPVKRKRT